MSLFGDSRKKNKIYFCNLACFDEPDSKCAIKSAAPRRDGRLSLWRASASETALSRDRWGGRDENNKHKKKTQKSAAPTLLLLLFLSCLSGGAAADKVTKVFWVQFDCFAEFSYRCFND